MPKNNNYQIDIVGWLLLLSLFFCLALAGYYSHKSIDWTILKRLEQSPLDLPTPIPTSTTNR